MNKNKIFKHKEVCQMRNIVVVECISTGTNYIQDIVARNYNPVVLEMAESGDNEEALRVLAEII